MKVGWLSKYIVASVVGIDQLGDLRKVSGISKEYPKEGNVSFPEVRRCIIK